MDQNADRDIEMKNLDIEEMNLAAPCGIYCGACRHYLARSKGMLEERGLRVGCEGCRVRDKQCVFIKKLCPLIRKKEMDFCFECEDFPCEDRKKLDQLYSRFDVDLLDNLLRMKKVGVKEWLKEQEDKWRCPVCEGNICVHDKECYDCGYEISQT